MLSTMQAPLLQQRVHGIALKQSVVPEASRLKVTCKSTVQQAQRAICRAATAAPVRTYVPAKRVVPLASLYAPGGIDQVQSQVWGEKTLAMQLLVANELGHAQQLALHPLNCARIISARLRA